MVNTIHARNSCAVLGERTCFRIVIIVGSHPMQNADAQHRRFALELGPIKPRLQVATPWCRRLRSCWSFSCLWSL